MRLLAAAGRVDVTPERPVPLAGYVGRTAPFERVDDPLEATCLVLRQGGRTAVVVTLDALYFSEALRLRLLEACAPAGVGEAELFVAASHTHFAPSTDTTKPRVGAVDAEYLAGLEAALVGLVREVLAAEAVPVRLRHARGEAAHAVNRRGRGWRIDRTGLHRGLTMLPNFEGERDDALHVVSLSRDDGTCLAVLWSTACHPVCHPGSLRVSAEFPGLVRRRLRARTRDAGLPVLFLQGFCGDLRPRSLGPGRGARWWALRLLNGRAFGPFTPAGWLHWATTLAERVVALFDRVGPELEPDLRASRDEVPRERLLDAESAGPGLGVQALRLARGLVLLGVGAEPVSGYGRLAREVFRPDELISVGYVGHTMCYLPTRAMLAEGGYEVVESLPLLGVAGRFRECVEDEVRAAFERVQVR